MALETISVATQVDAAISDEDVRHPEHEFVRPDALVAVVKA